MKYLASKDLDGECTGFVSQSQYEHYPHLFLLEDEVGVCFEAPDDADFETVKALAIAACKTT
jgi:hypothetical protein